MKFCARDICGSYMLSPSDLFLEPIRKNGDSYLTLKGTVMQIEKLNRCDPFNPNNKCLAYLWFWCCCLQ